MRKLKETSSSLHLSVSNKIKFRPDYKILSGRLFKKHHENFPSPLPNLFCGDADCPRHSVIPWRLGYKGGPFICDESFFHRFLHDGFILSFGKKL